jgi:hypothetical protein
MPYILAVVILIGLFFWCTSCDRKPFIGAMCYARVAIPETSEYICPKCGEKTLYPRESKQPDNLNTIMMVHYELEQCRRQVKQIAQLAVELDGSQFCKKCSPNTQKPQLILVIHFPGEQNVHHYTGVTSASIYQLAEFLRISNDCNDLTNDAGKRPHCIEQINTILGSK